MIRPVSRPFPQSGLRPSRQSGWFRFFRARDFPTGCCVSASYRWAAEAEPRARAMEPAPTASQAWPPLDWPSPDWPVHRPFSRLWAYPSSRMLPASSLSPAPGKVQTGCDNTASRWLSRRAESRPIAALEGYRCSIEGSIVNPRPARYISPEGILSDLVVRRSL